MRAVPPDINEEDICGPCGGKVSPCQSWSYIKSTNTFKSKHWNEICQIKKNFNCNSKIVVNLIECRVCGKQYNGSNMANVCARANSYKSTHHNFWRG